jgi:sarcosine oxidase gamma subunit
MRIAARTGGGYVACRAPRQYLVSAGDGAEVPAALRAAASALAYDSVDFALGGGGPQGVEDLLAEGCPTDLDQFDDTSWIPTQLFGVEVGLWRPRAGHYRVLAAPADGEFLGASVLDAVRRRHGELAGYDDYFAMQRTAAGG